MIKSFNLDEKYQPSRFYRGLRKCCNPIDQRYVITALIGFGILVNYMQRVCFYIAMVEMTKRETVDTTSFNALQEATWERCPHIFWESLEHGEGEFKDWSDATQGHLIASFFIGYIISSIFGGYIADRYGAKQIFGGTVILTSVFSVLTPLVARAEVGPHFVMVTRALMGFVQGPMFPAATSMLARWSPSHERPIHSAIANSGVPLASFLGNLLSGTILTYFSWHWVFYFFAMFGVLWFIIWEVFAFSYPKTHKFISPAEKVFIEYSVYHNFPPTKARVPWMDILRCFKFRIVAYANFGFDWGFYIVNMELPFYLRNVLYFPIMKIGMVSAMPWLSMWFGSFIFGLISQYLITWGIIRKLDMRKIMTVIATIVPGVLLILASWAGCAHVLVCLLFSVSMFYAGAVYSGIRLSVIDLAPNYAGVLMSLVNTFGSLAGLGVPLIVHSMIRDGGTLMEWRISFWIATIFMLLSSLPYIFFASCSVQPWNAGYQWEKGVLPWPLTPSSPPSSPPPSDREPNRLQDQSFKPFRSKSIEY